MTTKDEMLELAERCEKATGPNVLFDAMICKALNRNANTAEQIAGCSFVPRYTASLDAAMSLVPEEYGRIEFGRYAGEPSEPGRWCQITLDNTAGVESYVEAENCASEALALTAAALRARASHKDSNTPGE